MGIINVGEGSLIGCDGGDDDGDADGDDDGDFTCFTIFSLFSSES